MMQTLSKLLLLVLVISPILGAQNAESLLIGPGDMLHVKVFDNPDLEEHARVTDGGELPLVLGSSVNVSTLTPGQAARAIEVALSSGHFLLKPRVLVTVEENSTKKVSVIGEVHVPGAYVIETPRSVLDVLTLAGGLTDLADRNITIARHGTEEQVKYFFSNTASIAMNQVVMVDPGDTVVVPKAAIVYALGDVMRPGGFTVTNNEGRLSVLQLVSRAGGTPPTAKPSQAKLIRKSNEGVVEIDLPLADMEKGKRADFFLQADDIIYVPFSYLKNLALNGAGIAAAASSAAVYRF